MMNSAPSRRALPVAVAALAAGSALLSSPALATPSTNSVTYTGPTLDEIRVIVRVSIAVKNSQIIDVVPTVFVRTARSRIINAQVLPLLKHEVLLAQSANIQVVSGATITSLAYIASLRAAVRKARKARAL